MGIRKVTDDVDEVCYEVVASEQEFREAIEPIAEEYDVRLYIEHYEQEVRVNGEGSVLQIDLDGKRKHIEFNTEGEEKIFKLPIFSLVLYKREEDLRKFIEHSKSKGEPTSEGHRELGRLYGYGEEEIEEFVKNFSYSNA